MGGVVNLEAYGAGAAAKCLCGAEEARGFPVGAGSDRKCGEALERVGNDQVCREVGCARERASWASRSARSGSFCAIATRARVASAAR